MVELLGVVLSSHPFWSKLQPVLYAAMFVFTKGIHLWNLLKKLLTIFTGKCPASNNACPSVTSAVGSFKPLHQKRKASYLIEQQETLVIAMIWSTDYASLVFLGEEQRKMLPSLLPICFIFLWYFSTLFSFGGSGKVQVALGTMVLCSDICSHCAASLLASHAFGYVYSLSWRWQILLPWQCGIVQSKWQGSLTFLVCAAASLSVVGCLHWQSAVVLKDLITCLFCQAIGVAGLPLFYCDCNPC